VTVIVTVEWVFVTKLVEVIVIDFVDVLFIMVNISTQISKIRKGVRVICTLWAQVQRSKT
jgi:hypothetical protein